MKLIGKVLYYSWFFCLGTFGMLGFLKTYNLLQPRVLPSDPIEQRAWVMAQECSGLSRNLPPKVVGIEGTFVVVRRDSSYVIVPVPQDDSLAFEGWTDTTGIVFINVEYPNRLGLLRHEFLHYLIRKPGHMFQPFAICGRY